MEINLKTGPQGHVYFPKSIRKQFGSKFKLVPDTVAGVLYPENADLSKVIRSLEIIIEDLKLRQEVGKCPLKSH